MVGDYIESYGRASSDTSELDESGGDVYTEEERTTSSSAYSAGKEYRSMEWTDEKHSLYLKSMEASFVDQLYNSLGFLGLHLQNESLHPVGSSGCCHDNRKASKQQRMNVKRSVHWMDREDESDEFLSSQWIKRFQPLPTTQIVASPRLEGGNKLEHQVASSDKKKDMVARGSGSTISRRPIRPGHSFFHEHQQINIGEEVSDQNFIEEETNNGKASASNSSKKMKIMMKESSSNVQVVPNKKNSCNMKYT